MELASAITAFVTLFVIIDPVGLTPVFVALTRGMDSHTRRRIAIRGCLVGIGLLTVFGLAGEAVLNFIGIGMPAFRISGGILLFLTAFDMLFERRTQRRKGRTAEHDDPSIFPIAMPLIAGPGAMATMILLVGQTGGDPLQIFIIHLVMVVVVALNFFFFLSAGLLERGLGQSGSLVVTRLLGMLLAALAVQFVLDGLRDYGVIAGA